MNHGRVRLGLSWLLTVSLALAFLAVAPHAVAQDAPRVKILFLGDRGHHKPADRFKQLEPVFKARGIDLTYTERMADLNADNLKQYDGLMIYSNETRISPEQEKAMLDYVRSGHGLIPVHCASFCFQNSPAYIALVGGQFQKHKTGTFNTRVVDPNHSIMAGLKPFETWDETYVHTKLGKDLHVLQVRPESQPGGQGGEGEEPYTWTRNEGNGRVFYTAYGHDQRTFGNVGFQDLLERGTRWAVRADAASAFEHPKLVGPDPSAKPFEYVKTEGVPFYDPTSRQRNGGGVWNQMPKPLPPDESKKHMVVPEGFEAKLFVSEPDIVNPLTMNWDERGRLWVVESLDYPNRVTDPGKGNDRIKICEDTDGDGKADKFTIFAEGLNIPTSLTFYNGGVIVMERKSTWFLKDTDGDGKADVKKELITGWYRSLDTHAGPSNLHYGMDNWIWGMVGYAAFQGTVGDKQLRFTQGFYRFQPDGSQLEYIRTTSNNTWGLGFSDEGVVFGSTANGCPSVYMPIPNRYYESVRGGFAPEVLRMISPGFMFHSPNPKVRQVDFHGGYTAAAGHAVYTARAYPKEYWNRTAFVAEPTGHIVGTFVLEPDGANFKSRNSFNLLGSVDEWTSPIMAEVGPDGFVWVIDWYAYIIQHNPTPIGYKTGPGGAYITPRREDHHNGRIWRMTYSGANPSKNLDLSKASPAELVSALTNTNQFWRTHAQRLLVEKKDASVLPDLIKLVNDKAVDEIGLNVGAIHALWTLKGMNALDGSNKDALAAATGALKHPSAGVRRNAVQVLPPSPETLEAILDAKVLEDSDAQVRLMTLLAIADQPSGNAASNKAGAAIYAALKKTENITDRWIPDAAVAAAAKHDASFLHDALAASAKDNPNKAAPPQVKSGPVPAAGGPKEPQNLLANPGFEELNGQAPTGWHAMTHSGQGTLTIDSVGHTGAHSAHITSDRGGDVSWSQDVKLKPNTRYRLSAWVKTKGVDGQAMGALFNIHQLQQDGLPKPLKGDNDWTQLTSEFASGSLNSVTINMLFGGWGRSKGEAWWDDVQLIELGPGGPVSLSAANAGDDNGAGKLAQVFKIVTRHYADRAPGDSIVHTLEAIKGADAALAESVLDGLVAGWPDKPESAPKLSDGDKTQIAAIGKSLPPDQRDRLLVLANRWGQSAIFAGQMEEVLKTVKETLSSTAASSAERADAAKRLIRLNDDPKTIDAVLSQVTPQASSELSRFLILGLSESRQDDAAGQVIAKWGDFTPAARAAAVNLMMRRLPWTNAMLQAVQDKKLARNDLTASDWSILKTHKDPRVAGLARRLDTNQTDPNRQKVLDAFLPAAAKQGDVAAGQKTYTTLCAQCHTFNGQGGKVGPELSGIGARDPKEILADIIDPNRSVEANYRLWTIETKDGDSYSGRLDTETQTTVELLDATGEKHVIQRKDIASMNASALSVMPVGLVDTLKPDDISSLLDFLKTGHGPAPAPAPK